MTSFLYLNAFGRYTSVSLGMSKHHFNWTRITFKNDVTHALKRETLLVRCERGEFRQVWSMNPLNRNHFASLTRSNRRRRIGTRSRPSQWTPVQASLFNHSHHDHSLSNTAQELSPNAPSPNSSDLSFFKSVNHSLCNRPLLNSSETDSKLRLFSSSSPI